MNRLSMKYMLSLFIMVALLGTGCGFQPAKYLPWWGTASTGGGQKGIAEGNRLFWDGDYAAAESVFLRLRQSGNPEVARQALYGLACTRLIMAKNRQEYLDAVEILELWQEMAPAVADQEDPRMLLALFSETVPESPAEDDGSESHLLMRLLDRQEQIRMLESRIDTLNGQLAASDNEEDQDAELEKMAVSLKEMKKRLSEKEESEKAMAEELVKLKSQLKTLETIDQEIQEKKQGISSP